MLPWRAAAGLTEPGAPGRPDGAELKYSIMKVRHEVVFMQVKCPSDCIHGLSQGKPASSMMTRKQLFLSSLLKRQLHAPKRLGVRGFCL